MRRIIGGLLALILGSTISCNNQQESQSRTQPKVEEKIGDNPLLKGLQEVIDRSGFNFDKGREFVGSKVKEVYKKMNSALAQKDLPGFVHAYKEAKLFQEQLIKVGDCYGGSFHWMQLFDELNRSYFGNIYTKVMTDPQILDAWPTDCDSVNQKAKSLAEGLYDFDRNRHLSLGDKVGDKDGNGHQILHEDRNLLIANSGNIHANAITTGEGRYFLDGTIYTEMWFSEQADVMVYSLVMNTSSGSPLESTAHRECSFIDLGMDGIDACDARLNGVKEQDIATANGRAIDCMEKTTEVLKRRYAGTGFIK